MRKTLVLLAALFIAIASGAFAQTGGGYHTWVSNGGDDTSFSCDVDRPCATFATALTKTGPGGEITCLNTGYYGVASIVHSVTINCDGAIGRLLYWGNLNVPMIYVNASSTDVVTLRGLDLDGASYDYASTNVGLIRFYGAGTLRLEKMRVSNMRGTTSGVYFAPIGPAKLQVIDSIIANNGSGALAAGIYIRPAIGITATVAIERTAIENNNFGIFADATGGGTIKGIVLDSFVTGNTNNGITVSSSGAALAVLTIDNTKVANNGYGLVVGGGAAAMLVRRSTVVNNGTGLVASGGGNLYSYRDNSVNFNTPGGDGAFTQFLSLQ